jgi:Rha family phage regulatory protein
MNQLVHLSGDRLVVTTLEISNHFGKRHNDVLRAVSNLECSDEFRQNPSGGKPIAAPMYEITRDGFVFLCMGFTGQQAAVWKERYIEAFNQMERALRGQHPALRQNLALATEVGHLKDNLAARDQIIQAKDGVIMTLQDRLIGSQDRQIRLMGRVTAMQKRQHDREIIQLIERMELEGRSRDEIKAMTGKGSNYIRQRVHLARLAGRLPKTQEVHHG